MKKSTPYFGLLFTALMVSNVFAISSLSKQNNIPTDQAAVTYLSEQDRNKESFVSLLDVIKASLSRIKEEQANPTEIKEEKLGTDSVATTTATKDLADAIVNINCTQQTEKYKRYVSGTGFLLNDNGAIMTNAHVAQFLLLKGSAEFGNVECRIRTGKNGELTYNAHLLYISPTWILEHPDLIDNPKLNGTGENDFALLYINKEEHPEIDLAHISPSHTQISTAIREQTVILVGYPSLTGDFSKENRAIATTTIDEIYTFESGRGDILSLDESDLGHQGVSGGPVINNFGEAIGVLTTKDADSTALNAITISYINRRMEEETKFDLYSTIEGNLPHRASLFNRTVSPILQNFLLKNIE